MNAPASNVKNETKKTATKEADAPKLSPQERQAKRAIQFKKVASRRLNTIVKQTDLLCNCANRGAYHYEPEQVARMISALRDAIDKVEGAFNQRTKADVKIAL